MLDWQLPKHEVSALCPKCTVLWLNETMETCGICAKRVIECVCMPLAMQGKRYEGFCKLAYYTPHRRDAVQNRVIYRMKNYNDRRVADFLAVPLAESLERLLSECGAAREDLFLTYLPRTRTARLFYGTDQARALASALAKRMKIPMQRLIARRFGANRIQKKLSPEERLRNARRAFLPCRRAACRGKTVILVDDIVTTGAGMAACARLLRKMGAARVIYAAVATDAVNKDL